MSAAQARSAAPGSNRRSRTFPATGRSWWESVVHRDFRPVLAAIPWDLISFATVSTRHRCPRATSSAWTRGLP
jgi:hypothetical protein